jgi:hypothetical protein
VDRPPNWVTLALRCLVCRGGPPPTRAPGRLTRCTCWKRSASGKRRPVAYVTVDGALAKSRRHERLGNTIHPSIDHSSCVAASKSREGQTLASETRRKMTRDGERCLQRKTLEMIRAQIIGYNAATASCYCMPPVLRTAHSHRTWERCRYTTFADT